MSNIQCTKSLFVVAEPDVLVCGIGLAGIAAAVGAAWNGASVMASSTGGNNRNISIIELQDRLVSANVILDSASAMQVM